MYSHRTTRTCTGIAMGALLLVLALPAAAASPGFSAAIDETLASLDQALPPSARTAPPPRPVAPATAKDPATCTQIYREVTRLLPLAERHRPPFFQEARNRAIAIVGLVYPAAYYGWGLTAFTDYSQDLRQARVRQRIVALRRELADRRCFVSN